MALQARGRSVMRTLGRLTRGSVLEVLAVTLGGWLLLVTIPLGLGGVGLTWDALNHHIYLGWVANDPRFDKDFLAASYQSYQYPYLYWPAFQLMRLGAHGTTVGVVYTALAATAIPALWLVAKLCMADRSWFGVAMRSAAVLLALSGQLVLSLMDTTANDVIAAVPMVWSVALALSAIHWREREGWGPAVMLVLSGLCAGTAVAFKFSNGPLAILMPLMWLQVGVGVRARSVSILVAGAGAVVGFLLAYAQWGWQLWVEFGNPMFPFYDGWFDAVRAVTGWQRP